MKPLTKARVLMISLDKGLLGIKRSGDVVARHEGYGRPIDRLDIIVFANSGGAFRISDNVTSYSTRSSGLLGNLWNAYRVGRRLFRQLPYDLIVTQDPMFTGLAGWLLKLRYRAKLLVHLHGDFLGRGTWYRNTLRKRVRMKLARFIIGRSDGIRVMSDQQRTTLEQAGISVKKVRVISTPVDIGRFMQGADRQGRLEREDMPWPFTLLMVGRKDPVKDFQTLFKAVSIVFQQRPDVGLWLVGNYQDHSEIPLPDDRMMLTPYISTEDMPSCYRRADVVVLSSQSESFGKVLVEANASGKPVVATATAGAQEIVTDGCNGFLVEIGDSQALAERILELLSKPDLAARLGLKGQAMARDRYAGNSGKVVAYWNDIINGGADAEERDRSTDW